VTVGSVGGIGGKAKGGGEGSAAGFGGFLEVVKESFMPTKTGTIEDLEFKFKIRPEI